MSLTQTHLPSHRVTVHRDTAFPRREAEFLRWGGGGAKKKLLFHFLGGECLDRTVLLRPRQAKGKVYSS